MSNDARRVRFQLIRSPRRVSLDEDRFKQPFGQGLLFPLPKRDLLIFLVFPRVTEDEFTKTLEFAKPAAVLELRRSPRFDIGHLNRQEAFRYFEAIQSRYHDLASALTTEERNPPDPLDLVTAFLTRSTGSQIEGPIMFLINETLADEASPEDSLPHRIAKLFATISKHPWETVEIPQFA